MSKGVPGTVQVAATPFADTNLTGLIHRAGLSIQIVSDPTRWLARHRGSVLLTDQTEHVGKLTPAGKVIVFVDDPITAAWARSHGASTLPTRVSHHELTDAVVAASAGHRIIHPSLLGIPTTLSLEHTELYRALVTLRHVTDIAEHIGYSRTETYRRLKDLYHALGVTNREQALYLAGLLHVESGSERR